MFNLLKRNAPFAVLGFFIILCGLRLALAPGHVNLSSLQLSFFPEKSLGFLALLVILLKTTRKTPLLQILLASLTVICFFGFDTASEESVFPVRALISEKVLTLFHDLRYFTLTGLLLVSLRKLTRSSRLRNSSLHNLLQILPLFLMISCYPLAPIMIQAVQVQDMDSQMQAADKWMFLGNNPHLFLEKFINPTLSEWLAFCYSLYGLFFLIVFGAIFLKRGSRQSQSFVFMSTLALAIGYLSYSFFPVKGPLFSNSFKVDLSLYLMKDIKEALIDHIRIERDCFPSLHTTLSLLTLYSAWKFIRPLFWVFLPFIVCIPLACIYLRYHYVVDVIAGGILAWGVIRINSSLQALPTPEEPLSS